ncbi:MAG: peptide/nickel transport system substrate-binding protein [Gaiellaceae bacterium]|jgi:peptide/nickel transport system substrate-binding protein|nr:peptide/nickel transport system substrate-binding protein [Gaiellaceae bacterium]
MNRHIRYAPMFLVVAAFAVLAAGCGSKSSSSSTTTTTSSGGGGNTAVGTGTYDNGSSKKGGIYRIGWEQSFGFTNNFDPTGEYLGNAWGLYSNLMLRSLVGYKHLPGAAGNETVGDLATDVPQPTDGGLTYTYHLRGGIKWGPPVNRVVTSKDVAYAMNRLANPDDGGQYSFYYTDIVGWDAVASGKTKTVSGITTPDDKTVIIKLTKPVGDFNLRMSMPATAPIPSEVGDCFAGKPGDYGRDVVSNGPYMLQGMDKVKLPCSALKPASGYDGANGNHLILVRNPAYDQSTDSYRKNYPDQFAFRVNSNADDIFAQVKAGTLEDEVSSPQPKTIREYATDPSLKPMMIANVGDRTNYFTMNLTQPPFDDVHIRKAMNWIVDKSALQKAWGGPIPGAIANHIVPPVLYNNGLAEYDPYATANHAGDLAKAQAEIKLSKYDPGKTGKCTAAACKGVLVIADTRAVDTRMVPLLQADAAKIGLTLTVRSINGAYTTIQTPAKNIPMSERPSWGKDFADPGTFFSLLFHSKAIIKEGNTNYSLVGITPAIAAKVGATGNIANVPTVDPDIDKCQAELGTARTTCWENLDKKLMEQVVPWVPYLWPNNVFVIGPTVTHWNYDQFTDGPAYSSVSVK